MMIGHTHNGLIFNDGRREGVYTLAVIEQEHKRRRDHNLISLFANRFFSYKDDIPFIV